MAIRWRGDIEKWEGDYYDAAGKRRFIYRPEGKKGELEEELAGIILKKRGGAGVIVSRTMFKEFAERWKRDRQAGLIRGARNRPYKPSALRSVERDLDNYLNPAFGPERLGRIGLDGIEALDADLAARGLAVSTRRNVFGVLSQILDHAVRKRLIEYNPSKNLELIGGDAPPRRGAVAGAESPLSEAKAEEYIQAAMDMYQPRVYGGKRGENPMPWGAALPLMAVTALRVGEMYGLEWRHLTLTGECPEVEVAQAWDRKEGKIEPKSEAAKRTIPIRRDVAQRLLEWRMVCPDRSPSARVFPFGMSTAYKVHVRVLAAIGAPRFKLHGLRSVAASLWRARGVPQDLRTYYMGHEEASTTDKHYTRLTAEQIGEGRKLLSPAPDGSVTVAQTMESKTR